MPRRTRFSPEVRARAVRMVVEHEAAHESQWATITSIAEKIGCAAETLRKWVRQAERDAGNRPGLTTEERDRLRQLERENFELRRANEILKKASAYFAQAELDRRARKWGASSTRTGTRTGSSRSARCCALPHRCTRSGAPGGAPPTAARHACGATPSSAAISGGSGRKIARSTASARCGSNCGVNGGRSPAAPWRG